MSIDIYNTLNQRESFIKQMMRHLSEEYDLSDTQIFIFGSFLTDEYEPGISDIDIGIYSEDEVKMYDIKYSLDRYLQGSGLKHDLVIMYLDKRAWINIPIMIYGKQQTEYFSTKLSNYLIDMVKEWGVNPLCDHA